MFARSFAKRFLLIGMSSVVLSAFGSTTLLADDPSPQVDNSKISVIGVVNSNDVYVRSGPGENYYPTQKLEKGAQVTVVGLKYDWLKVVPPEGSFSFVAKAYVEKRGDGTAGLVTKPDLNVRAGSDVVPIKTTVQTKLEENSDVTILGEQDEYFKIKPPQGAYLYINKQFVDKVKELPAVTNVATVEPIASAPIAPIVSSTPDAGTATTQPAVALAVPTTQSTVNDAVAVVPATQPATPTAQVQFDAMETTFLDASNSPIDKQPIDVLLQGYEALSKAGELPVSMQRVADIRIATLKLRADARDQYVAAQKMQDDARARQTALKAEQSGLVQRVKENEVTMYTAVGTLRTSSLQQPSGTLYRLTDPLTGHTLLYVRSSDPQFAGMLNKFIGVKGDITEDATMSLKFLTPIAAEEVDQSKVNSTVSAQIIPPSMLPKMPTASVSGN